MKKKKEKKNPDKIQYLLSRSLSRHFSSSCNLPNVIRHPHVPNHCITNYLSKERSLYPSVLFSRVVSHVPFLVFSFDWQWAARLSRSRSHALTILVHSILLHTQSLSHSQKNAGAGRPIYGRSLYKINNDTSTKFIEGIVIIIVIVVIVAVRSRRIIVLKKVTSLYSFFLAWPLDARARGQSSRDKCVRLGCISRLLV